VGLAGFENLPFAAPYDRAAGESPAGSKWAPVCGIEIDMPKEKRDDIYFRNFEKLVGRKFTK
jgi:hypothetical protein